MGFQGFAGLVLAAGLLVACGGGGEPEDEYRYDRADVEAALFGTWQGSWQELGATEPSDLVLEIRAADEPPLDERCGNRELAGSGLGLRCISSSSLAASATLTLADGSEPAELDGQIAIHSLILSEAWLELGASDSPFVLRATWRDGGWPECQAQTASGEAVAGCTLAER